jgi:Ca2+-binding EF-hand superfamily protein
MSEFQVVRYTARRSAEEHLASDFALFDINSKGNIDASDLRRIAKTLPHGSSVTDADIASM